MAACQILVFGQFGANSFGSVVDMFGNLPAGADGFAFGNGIFDMKPPNWADADKYDFEFEVWKNAGSSFAMLPGLK